MNTDMSEYIFRINAIRQDGRNLVHEIVDVTKADLKDPAKYRKLFEQVLDETVRKFMANEQTIAEIDRNLSSADRG